MNHVNPTLSIISPVYLAKQCVDELVERINFVLTPLQIDFEIILVDDGSPDDSWEKLREIANKYPHIKSIQLSRNFGQHSAISAGLSIAAGDLVVVMDCDLQDPPEAIPELYSTAQKGFDIVLVKRMHRKDSFSKKLSSFLFHMIFSLLSGKKMDSNVGNFRIISRRVVKELNAMPERLRFFGAMVDWLGFAVATIEVEHSTRFAGESSYSLRKLLSLAFSWTIAYSARSLKFLIILGITISSFSFIYGFFIIIRAIFYGIPVTGWASLIVSIYFLGGVLSFAIGILGVYIGLIFDQTRLRPVFVIKQALNCDLNL